MQDLEEPEAQRGARDQVPQGGLAANPPMNAEVLRRSAEFIVVARHHRKGAVLAEVVKCMTLGSEEKSLGQLRCVLNKNGTAASMNAICRIHTSCQCWVSNMESSDLLLDWLVTGDTMRHEEHQALAKDLKRSVGMKIRG